LICLSILESDSAAAEDCQSQNRDFSDQIQDHIHHFSTTEIFEAAEKRRKKDWECAPKELFEFWWEHSKKKGNKGGVGHKSQMFDQKPNS
jgi:hypothetical protein